MPVPGSPKCTLCTLEPVGKLKSTVLPGVTVTVVAVGSSAVLVASRNPKSYVMKLAAEASFAGAALASARGGAASTATTAHANHGRYLFLRPNTALLR